MKRKGQSWRDKVDDYCFKYLEAYGKARRLVPGPGSDLATGRKWARAFAEAYKPYPELQETKVVHLDRKFIRLLQEERDLRGLVKPGENRFPVLMAEVLEVAQRLALGFETKTGRRIDAYLFFAFCFVVLRGNFDDLQRQRYGSKPAPDAKVGALAARFFDMIAGLCRGQYVQPKDRIDTELQGLVNLIQEHRKEWLADSRLDLIYVHSCSSWGSQ